MNNLPTFFARQYSFEDLLLNYVNFKCKLIMGILDHALSTNEAINPVLVDKIESEARMALDCLKSLKERKENAESTQSRGFGK